MTPSEAGDTLRASRNPIVLFEEPVEPAMDGLAVDPRERPVGAFVLIVDDNPETLHLLARALEYEGIEVRTAGSVFRALESLHDGSPRPALIITDLVMPRTTGWDFLKHLRAESAMRSVPVIVITGAEPGESEELADVVLQKPIDPVELGKTVRGLLTKSS